MMYLKYRQHTPNPAEFKMKMSIGFFVQKWDVGLRMLKKNRKKWKKKLSDLIYHHNQAKISMRPEKVISISVLCTRC